MEMTVIGIEVSDYWGIVLRKLLEKGDAMERLKSCLRDKVLTKQQMKPVTLEVSTYDLALKLFMFKIWTRGNKKHSKIKLGTKVHVPL